MQNPTRPSKPASDTSRQWALRDRSGSDFGGAGHEASNPASSGGFDPQSLIDSFAASLSDVEMDDRARQFFNQEFEGAIRDAAANPKPGPGLERSDWIHAVDLLRKMGAVDESESNTLVRQLDQAMEPLQRRNVQLAMEFGRRCQEEGEAKAIEWFRSQSIGGADTGSNSSQAPGHTTQDKLPQGDMITRSRSRRLRGPPTR